MTLGRLDGIFAANDQQRALSYMQETIAQLGGLGTLDREEWDRVRQTPQVFVSALTDLRDRLGAIGQDLMLSSAAREAQLEQAWMAAARAIDSAMLQASGARTRLEGAAKTALAPAPITDSSAALLAEQQEQRAWQRAERLLSGGQAVGAVIRSFADAHDRVGLAALRVELPSWIVQTLKPAPAISGGQVSPVEQGVADALQLIDELEFPLLTDNQRRARATLAELARGWPRIVQGREQAMQAIQLRTQTFISIPGWGASEGYTVSLVPLANG